MSKYAVIFEAPEPGGNGWAASVPDLPGLFAFGETREECERVMAEALPEHVRSMREHGLEVPEPSTYVTMADAA